MTMTEEQQEYDFVGKVAAHYGVSRQQVLHCFYFVGKRQFLAILRARALIGRLKQTAQEVKVEV
jgi:hypothetical protein